MPHLASVASFRLAALLAVALGPACTGKPVDSADPLEDDGGGSSSDTTNPLISLDAPLDGQEVAGTMSWAATASDDVRVANVTLYVDDYEADFDVVEPWGGEWDSAGALNGSHTLLAVAEDAAGNTGDASVEISVANEDGLDPDAILVTNPSEGATICGQITVLTQVSEEVAQVTFALDGAEMELDTVPSFSWDWDTTTTYDGEHRVTATAQDAEGRQAFDAVTFAVDNEGESCDNAPSVVFTEPEGGVWLAGAQEVAVTATDDLGVVSVALYVDSGLLSTDTAVPYEIVLSTADFDDGSHLLKAVATDTSGLSAEAELTIYTDNTAPVVLIDEPGVEEILQGVVDWRASVSDSIELAEVWFLLDDEVYASFTEDPFEVELDTTALDHGPHTLAVQAVDLAGNETIEQIELSVDNPPVIVFTEPTDTEVSGTVSVSARATDDDLLTSLELYQDGASVDSATGDEPVRTSFDTCDLAYGETIELEAIAIDSGGNLSSESLILTVDQPLMVEIGTFDTALDYTETLSADVSDDQRVTSVVFALDGTTVATATSASSSSEDCFDCGCEVWTRSWSTASASEGTHTLSVTVTNSAGETATDSTTITIDHDHDDDGYDAEFYGGTDCDDADATTSPGDAEGCDDVDNDCDGETDEDFDVDGDGYLEDVACSALVLGTDCDDADADVNPDATETCDEVDNDCDGVVDRSGAGTDTTSTFSTNSHSLSASGTYGNVYKATTNAIISTFSASLNPGTGTYSVTYTVFESSTSTGTYTRVASGTGTVSGSSGWFTSPSLEVEMTSGYYYLLAVASSSTLTRLGDSTSPVMASGGGLTLAGYTYNSSATATTVTNDPSTSQTYYQQVVTEVPASVDADADADGYSTFCGDCDEGDATISPVGVEGCDGVDEDCNGVVDDTVDADGDGSYACEDCDDADGTSFPEGTEICDEVDNDCDGETDEDPADGSLFYRDYDGDGYGERAVLSEACSAGDGWSALNTDCDDLDSAVNPGAAESCNGLDDDCDGSADEGLGAADADGDGTNACGDCDDADASVGPDETDTCEDGIDQDCDDYDADCAFDGAHEMPDIGYKWRGESLNDYTGESLSAAGDVDGDGFGDLLIGAKGDDDRGGDAGAVYLMLGPVTSAGQLSISTTVKITGASGGLNTGYAVSGLTDQDGDGYDDIAISAPYVGGSLQGATYVQFGPVTADMNLSSPDVTLGNTETDALFGTALAAGGDSNGDGVRDLLVTALFADGDDADAGVVYLFAGPVDESVDASDALAKMGGIEYADYVGTALAGDGDVDGDGYDEVLIGASEDGSRSTGAVYVVNGPVSGSMSLSDADTLLSGVSRADYTGEDACLSDVNLDGYADAVVTAAGRTADSGGEGAVYIVHGPLGSGGSFSDADLTLTGSETAGDLGNAIACGDINLDGWMDLLAGVSSDSTAGTSAGAAWVWFGPISASGTTDTSDASFFGEDSNDQLGDAVAIVPNLDGDGLGALLLGACYEDHSSTPTGSSYILPYAEIP